MQDTVLEFQCRVTSNDRIKISVCSNEEGELTKPGIFFDAFSKHEKVEVIITDDEAIQLADAINQHFGGGERNETITEGEDDTYEFDDGLDGDKLPMLNETQQKWWMQAVDVDTPMNARVRVFAQALSATRVKTTRALLEANEKIVALQELVDLAQDKPTPKPALADCEAF